MRAAICTRYGGPEVVETRDVARPAPKPDQLLIRVGATTVASGDHRVRAFDLPPGFRAVGRLAIGWHRPRNLVLGTEFAGVVEEVGTRVKGFQVGESVFGAHNGTHAEFVCVREKSAIVKKPDNVGVHEAAAIPFGGVTAVYFWRDLARLKPKQRVLVYGASGSVGTSAVQVAKHYGAHVTGVCSSANVRLVQSLGADEVIDYTKEDFTKARGPFDAVFDTVQKTTLQQCRPLLARKGVYMPAVATLGQLVRASVWRRGRVRTGVAIGNKHDVQLLGALAAKGEFKPVIDRRFSFEEIVAAHRYVDGGHKKGNVVVTFDPPSKR